jgi:hypothetical protein
MPTALPPEIIIFCHRLGRVYSSPQAVKELHWTLGKLETAYPEATFIVAVEKGPPFGKSNHASILLLPSYRQKLNRKYPW